MNRKTQSLNPGTHVLFILLPLPLSSPLSPPPIAVKTRNVRNYVLLVGIHSVTKAIARKVRGQIGLILRLAPCESSGSSIGMSQHVLAEWASIARGCASAFAQQRRANERARVGRGVDAKSCARSKATSDRFHD